MERVDVLGGRGRGAAVISRPGGPEAADGARANAVRLALPVLDQVPVA